MKGYSERMRGEDVPRVCSARYTTSTLSVSLARRDRRAGRVEAINSHRWSGDRPGGCEGVGG